MLQDFFSIAVILSYSPEAYIITLVACKSTETRLIGSAVSDI